MSRRALARSARGGMMPTVFIVGALLARPFVFYAPGLRAAVDTVIALCVLSAAWLTRRRGLASRRPRDLILTSALLAVAFIELVALAAPAALALKSGRPFAAAALPGSLGIAVAFFIAAVATQGRPMGRSAQDTGRVALSVAVVSTACAVLLGFALQRRLILAGADPRRGLDAALDHPLAALVAGLSGTLLIAAAIALLRQSAQTQGSDYRELAGPLVFLAAAQIVFFEIPRVPPQWYSSAEVLRLGAAALFLRWAASRDRDARAALVRAAALAERRQVARDLHDGIAQDLAFIAAHGARLRADFGDAHPLVVAARRALAHSRGAIADLRGPDDATTAEALELIASELGPRFEVTVSVDVELDHELTGPLREDAGRIVSEAVANAARHGGARNVAISVTQTRDRVTLRVADDGCGIGDAPQGFGLASIRERASAHGGSMQVRERPAGGTEMEVTFP